MESIFSRVESNFTWPRGKAILLKHTEICSICRTSELPAQVGDLCWGQFQCGHSDRALCPDTAFRLQAEILFTGQGINTFSDKPNSYCWVILCCFCVWLGVTQVCFVREWKHKTMADFKLHEVMTETMTWETILCFFQSCHWWDFIWLWLKCISQASDVELLACLSSLCRLAFLFVLFFSLFTFVFNFSAFTRKEKVSWSEGWC